MADDGRGFVPEALDELDSGHLGLLGMRKRTRLLGGHLEVRTAADHGTVVEATVPLGLPRPERGAVAP